jgi:hypothetical protein
VAVKETNPLSDLDFFYAYLEAPFSTETSEPYFVDMFVVEGISEQTNNNRVAFTWTKWLAKEN